MASTFDIRTVYDDPLEEAALLANLRRNDPVHWDEKREWWLLTRHSDVKQVSRDPDLYSSEPHGPWHELESHFSIQATDGPLHHATRNVVSKSFTPRTIAELEKRTLTFVDEAIDAVAAEGRCDLVRRVALPVPMRVIADMLGMEGEIERFKRWCDAVESMTAGGQPPTPEREAACSDFAAFVREVVSRRTAHPEEDLISAMVTPGNEEILEPFRRDPFPGIVPGDGVMGFIAFLVLAGSDTTRHAIAQGMRVLMERPDDMQRLREQPELLPTAVDEILRFVSPVRAMRRTVMRDVELRGRSLRAGQSVVLVYTSANRDEEVFEEPDRFRIDRTPNDHLAFGWGTHFCLGSNLARMEIRVAISRLLERLPDLRPEPGTRPTRYFSSILNGLDALPVVFTPAAGMAANV